MGEWKRDAEKAYFVYRHGMRLMEKTDNTELQNCLYEKCRQEIDAVLGYSLYEE